MTFEELEAEHQADMAAKDELRERMLARKAEMDRLIADDEATRLLVGKTPGQIDAIARAARATANAVAVDLSAAGEDQPR